MSYSSVNPYSGEQKATIGFISNREMESKLEQGGKAFLAWKDTPAGERTDMLQRAAGILRKNKETLAALITREMGKVIAQSLAEVEKCAWACEYYAENTEKFMKEEMVESAAGKSRLLFRPTGIIFGIMPWNFPFWQAFRYIVPNLAAGNAALLRHASNVPLCASAIESVIAEAGAPAGVFQNLFIDYEQAARVIAHPAVSGVTLTGSNEAGNRVAGLAGMAGKKTVLELGGSDPYIVFSGADLEQAMKTGIMARFQNNGQSCIAAKRFIIQDDIFDHFLEGFTGLVKNLKTGDPMDPDTEVGPVARPDLLRELQDQLRGIVARGARIECGGRSHGNILEPAVVTGLPPEDPLNRQELFGPVVPLFRFHDPDEALEIANNSPFGLGASVWTGDTDLAGRMAVQLETGTVTVNGMVRSEPGLPFGGVKASGYGRELSLYGFREFLNIKTVSYF